MAWAGTVDTEEVAAAIALTKMAVVMAEMPGMVETAETVETVEMAEY